MESPLWDPTKAFGNETLPPGQELPTPSDKQERPQESPRAPTYRPVLVPLSPLTSAPNPPTAATEGPVPSPGSAQPTQQLPLGLTASNRPAHRTEAPGREEGAASALVISHLPGPSSSLSGSLQTPTSGTVSGTTETTKVTMTFAGTRNTTVSSRSPPVPRFPLMTKAVTARGHDSFTVKATSLKLPQLLSPSSRPVTSPGATSWPPSSLGSHLTMAVTKVTNKTVMSPSTPVQSTSSSSYPLTVVSMAEQTFVSPLVTKGLEEVPATEMGESVHSQPTELPVSPHPSSGPTDLPHPAQDTTTAPRPPALSPGTLGAVTSSTGAHRLGATALVSLQSTQPPQLLSGLPPDTSLPLAKVGTSAPVATPGSTPPPQPQATTLATAMTVTSPAQTLSLTVSLMSAVEGEAHSPSAMVPQVTGTAPDLILGATLPSSGASSVSAGEPPTVSVAPRKSTTQKTAILSKKVSPPTLISGSAQGGFTELTEPVVSHTVTPLVMEAEGPQAGTVPLVPTSHSLSWVAARTASRESPLVLLPQLAEAHGTPAGLEPQEDLVRRATTVQAGRSAPAHSIAEGSMEADVNISATCVVSDVTCQGFSVCESSPRPGR